VFLVPEAGGH
jgi:hypothetical protein